MPVDQPTPPAEPPEAIMRGPIPYLVMAGRASEAAAFYERAFAAIDWGRMPDPANANRLLHVQVEINGGALMMTDHGMVGAAEPPAMRGHLQLVVADGRSWFDRAVAAGCTVVEQFGPQFWGDRWGLLLDPFGIHWAILTPGLDHA